MNIRKIHENKKQFLPLLLLADEQEDMIDRYLERGTMYVLEDNGVKAECVITDEGGGILELKNLAVEPEAQRKGYGRALIDFLVRTYAGRYTLLQVGTGDSSLTVPFYEKCGFVRFLDGAVLDEPTGEERPARFYALTREQWAEQNGGR